MNELSIPTLIVASVALLLFCLPAGAMTVLGTGAGALIGGDLTDPENDGAADADVNYNATFTSDNEPAFGGGEFSFNVFDNRTGGGSDKWCCDDASPGNILYGPGHQLTAQLDGGQAVLSQFTMTSSNDSAPRDPVVWGIQGSNDGTNFTTIYAQNGSVWSARRQVVLFEAGIDYNMPAPYEYFRYSVTETAGGSQHALGEIEYIGTLGTAAEIGGDNTIGSLAQSGILENEMPVAAELIRITQNKPTGSNPLMLAEVQAFQTGTGTNVALAGTATQSSQLGGFAPGLAIDDNLGNFTHTNDGFGQWWEVDLPRRPTSTV